MILTVGADASVVASSSGGTRVYALQLLGNMVELRPEWNFVLYLRRDSERGELGPLAQARNVRIKVVAGRPNAWRVQAALPRQLERDDVDVYHSLGYFLPLRWRGVEVVTVHDLNVYVTPRNWLRGPTLLPWLDLASQTWLSIRRADRIIAVSASSRDQLHRVLRVSDGRVAVIPEAADPYFQERATREELDGVSTITSGSEFVLFVGILSPQKNVLTLVRAFARAGVATAGVRLVLAGSDRERYAEIVRRAAREAGVQASVVVPGFVTQAQLRALYQSALCLVLPSHGEGFGLPIVEAMAAGAPILAARRQAIPEVLGDAGCMFEPDDVDALADLLKRVVSDEPFRKEMAQRSREHSKNYSWRRAAELTAAVYEEAYTSRRR